MKKIHLATVSILVKDRHSQAPELNQLLTEHGSLILARLGYNLQPKCIAGCKAIITLLLQGPAKDIRDFTEKIDRVYGIVAKKSMLTE